MSMVHDTLEFADIFILKQRAFVNQIRKLLKFRLEQFTRAARGYLRVGR